MASKSAQRLKSVQQHLAYTFKNTELLDQACTHASFCDANAPEQQRLNENNERMEFLGDGLLGAAVGLLMYQEYPDASEGHLSKLRSHLVSRKTLAKAIDARGLLEDCPIDANLQTPWPGSVKANIAEAILGAIYLDGGWDAMQAAVKTLLDGFFDGASKEQAAGDAKNLLQTWALKHHRSLPQYQSKRTGGTDHEPEFICTVSIADRSATASGTSKRHSEAQAAKALLAEIKQSES